MSRTLRLRSGEYEILGRAKLGTPAMGVGSGLALDPVAATRLLRASAGDPAAMQTLRLALAEQMGTHGWQRRDDSAVMVEFTRLLASGRIVLRPLTVPSPHAGNAGRFIVRLLRTRKDEQADPTVISVSLWQVVKAVPGTWLTAVAKYGLKPPWPDKDLHRVYSDEWVQKCDPVDVKHDTEPKYTFWKVFSPGGRWEDGVDAPPKEAKLRDKEIDVDSYWCFKIRETAEFTKPGMDSSELLTKRKKMFDMLFREALTLGQKKTLLDKLAKLEKAAKGFANAKLNEERKRGELRKLLEDLKQAVKVDASKTEAAAEIEGWFKSALRSLDKSVQIKESMERRVLKEIKYVKFRCAEYDSVHEGDQRVESVQKGTAEEHQWKNTPVTNPR
jgi:hypothetical protein